VPKKLVYLFNMPPIAEHDKFFEWNWPNL